MGDRACVDTTSLLGKDEGMIVGSTSQGGILVCSETHHLPYMRLREFRVNAGAVHSYVWAPNNMSAYLADIQVGDPLMAINTKGETRTISLGRVKIERRPLLLIKAVIKNKPVNVIIQDDWHVRVMGVGGRVRHSTTLEKGDKLFGYLDEPGRHVGIKIDETIQER
jgi:3-dehydroquinate synthase II/3-amino-4-hydroxybenzoic acid synthase